MKTTPKLFLAVLTLIASFLVLCATVPSYAVGCPGGAPAPDGECPTTTPPTAPRSSTSSGGESVESADLGDWKLEPDDGNLEAKNTKTCGSGSTAVPVAFDFGCTGTGNAIIDIAFAIFRFLSYGVGLIVIGSIVVAGIQYSASRGDPHATEASIKRVSNAGVGLLL